MGRNRKIVWVRRTPPASKTHDQPIVLKNRGDQPERMPALRKTGSRVQRLSTTEFRQIPNGKPWAVRSTDAKLKGTSSPKQTQRRNQQSVHVSAVATPGGKSAPLRSRGRQRIRKGARFIQLDNNGMPPAALFRLLRVGSPVGNEHRASAIRDEELFATRRVRIHRRQRMGKRDGIGCGLRAGKRRG